MELHTSVLPDQTIEWLAPAPGKTIIDGTIGFGGHAERILERLGPEGKLIGFDRDPFALAKARERLERFGDRVMLFKDNFTAIPQRLKENGIAGADGILLDLGVSSVQLETPSRGFSFLKEGPLDMRMDPDDALTAADIVNGYSKPQLQELIGFLGEERYAGRIASRIVEERSRRRQGIRTTTELASIIYHAVPSGYRYGRIHPATRTFQALRIAVNRELESLGIFLKCLPDWLASSGRAVIISFHSLEDRLVKVAFRDWQKSQLGRVLTKKPVSAAPDEISKNPRARSAKLRAFKKGGQSA